MEIHVARFQKSEYTRIFLTEEGGQIKKYSMVNKDILVRTEKSISLCQFELNLYRYLDFQVF